MSEQPELPESWKQACGEIGEEMWNESPIGMAFVDGFSGQMSRFVERLYAKLTPPDLQQRVTALEGEKETLLISVSNLEREFKGAHDMAESLQRQLEAQVGSWKNAAFRFEADAEALRTVLREAAALLNARSAFSTLARRFEAALASPARAEPKCVIGEYCSRHGFIHGAEAEELRQRLGALRKAAVDAVLDNVDARDSLAWCEFLDAAQRTPAVEPTQVKP